MNNQPLVIERVLNASIETVWRALTEADHMKQWYFNIPDFKPETGFSFSFEGGSAQKTYKHLCTVVEVVPGRKLAHTWHYEGYPGMSVVSFELFPEGDNQTRITLTHEGIESMSENGPDFQRSSFTEGWTYIIGKSLKEYVEGLSTPLQPQ